MLLVALRRRQTQGLPRVNCHADGAAVPVDPLFTYRDLLVLGSGLNEHFAEAAEARGRKESGIGFDDLDLVEAAIGAADKLAELHFSQHVTYAVMQPRTPGQNLMVLAAEIRLERIIVGSRVAIPRSDHEIDKLSRLDLLAVPLEIAGCEPRLEG
jgi:hypothetical protein